MGKVKITQIRSTIKRNIRQKRIIEALGLKKIHHTVELPDKPHIQGMINKVSHLVKVEKINK
jgi:large subunit ribosomal protein L30